MLISNIRSSLPVDLRVAHRALTVFVNHNFVEDRNTEFIRDTLGDDILREIHTEAVLGAAAVGEAIRRDEIVDLVDIERLLLLLVDKVIIPFSHANVSIN